MSDLLSREQYILFILSLSTNLYRLQYYLFKELTRRLYVEMYVCLLMAPYNIYLRKELGGIPHNLVQLLGAVGAKVLHGLGDGGLPGDARGLVLPVPSLDVHNGEPRVERILEILKQKCNCRWFRVSLIWPHK